MRGRRHGPGQEPVVKCARRSGTTAPRRRGEPPPTAPPTTANTAAPSRPRNERRVPAAARRAARSAGSGRDMGHPRRPRAIMPSISSSVFSVPFAATRPSMTATMNGVPGTSQRCSARRPRRRRRGGPTCPRGPARAATAGAVADPAASAEERDEASPSRAEPVRVRRVGAELRTFLELERVPARSAAPARRPGGTAPAPAPPAPRRRARGARPPRPAGRRARASAAPARSARPALPGPARGRSGATSAAPGRRRSSCRAARDPPHPRQREVHGERGEQGGAAAPAAAARRRSRATPQAGLDPDQEPGADRPTRCDRRRSRSLKPPPPAGSGDDESDHRQHAPPVRHSGLIPPAIAATFAAHGELPHVHLRRRPDIRRRPSVPRHRRRPAGDRRRPAGGTSRSATPPPGARSTCSSPRSRPARCSRSSRTPRTPRSTSSPIPPT